MNSILVIYPFIISFVLMMIGLYGILVTRNLIKKLLALSIFQTSIIVIYINIASFPNLLPPIVYEKDLYANPVPHALMLTAIVVGIVTIAIGYALIIKIKSETNK